MSAGRELDVSTFTGKLNVGSNNSNMWDETTKKRKLNRPELSQTRILTQILRGAKTGVILHTSSHFFKKTCKTLWPRKSLRLPKSIGELKWKAHDKTVWWGGNGQRSTTALKVIRNRIKSPPGQGVLCRHHSLQRWKTFTFIWYMAHMRSLPCDAVAWWGTRKRCKSFGRQIKGPQCLKTCTKWILQVRGFQTEWLSLHCFL